MTREAWNKALGLLAWMPPAAAERFVIEAVEAVSPAEEDLGDHWRSVHESLTELYGALASGCIPLLPRAAGAGHEPGDLPRGLSNSLCA